MKHIFLVLLFFPVILLAQQQTINVGTAANDHSGDPLRTAFQKTNSNFTELYGGLSSLTTIVSGKQATLISGTNIKTINSSSLLGSGDISTIQTITLTGDVTGSGTGSFATVIKNNLALGGSPTTTTQSQADNSTKISTTAYVDTGLSGKQSTLVSGTNIKTINSTSLLGSGDLSITSVSGNAGTASALQTGRLINDKTFDGTANIALGSTQNAQSGTSYTLILTDAAKTIMMSNASANSVHVPANSSVAFPAGTIIQIVQTGAGLTSVVADGTASVTYPSGGSQYSNGQGGIMKLYKTATDAWQLLNGVPIVGSTFSKVDDTNVGLTLSGSPGTAVLYPMTVTVNWLAPLPISRGGTNITGYTAGDILYSSATNVLSKLAKGSDTQALVLGSGLPTWNWVVTPLSDFFTDVGNVTTGVTDLFSTTIAASRLATNGDRIDFEYSGTILGHATATRTIVVSMGGNIETVINNAITTLDLVWSVTGRMTRVDATHVRYTIYCIATQGSGTIFSQIQFVNQVSYTLTNPMTLKITGQAGSTGASTNDIIAKMGNVKFVPAAH